MSLMVTVYVPEGLVMAADSRLTIGFGLKQTDGSNRQHSMPSSDSTHKLLWPRISG